MGAAEVNSHPALRWWNVVVVVSNLLQTGDRQCSAPDVGSGDAIRYSLASNAHFLVAIDPTSPRDVPDTARSETTTTISLNKPNMCTLDTG